MGGGRRIRRWLSGAVLILAVGATGSAPGGWTAPAVAAASGPPRGASGGAAPEVAAPAVLPQTQPVRIGVVETASEAGIHVANERGYFVEQGLTPEYVRFESATFAVAPLSTGA